MNRRELLKVLTLGLVTGPSALEMFERLTWEPRRLWLGASFTNTGPIALTDPEIAQMLRRVYADFEENIFPVCTPLSKTSIRLRSWRERSRLIPVSSSRVADK